MLNEHENAITKNSVTALMAVLIAAFIIALILSIVSHSQEQSDLLSPEPTISAF